MATPQPKQDTALEIRRIFNAPREEVFQAWTDPQAVARWFGPKDGYRVEAEELDLRVGGRYRFALQPPEGDAGYAGDGAVTRAGGVYTVVDPPRRLAFTFTWEEGGMDIGETSVTIDLYERGEMTELVLTHEGLPSEEARLAHGEGWNGSLERLGRFVQ